MVLIRDLIQRDLYSVEPDRSVSEVTRRMAELRIGAIVVLSGGRLCGVFSERDVMTRVVIGRLDPDKTPVSEVMTTEVATIDDTQTIDLAMESMRVNQCRHLPVICGEEVVAFLSMRDLMHFELNRKTEELHRMRAYVHGIL